MLKYAIWEGDGWKLTVLWSPHSPHAEIHCDVTRWGPEVSAELLLTLHEGVVGFAEAHQITHIIGLGYPDNKLLPKFAKHLGWESGYIDVPKIGQCPFALYEVM